MGPSGTIIHLPKPTPSEACDLELSALSSRPEFQTECVFGGPMPKDMLERNRQKVAAFNRAQNEIIAKYGLFDEYLQPLLAEEKRLDGELAEVRAQIAELRALRKQ